MQHVKTREKLCVCTGPGGVAHLSGALTEEACRCVTQCYAALSSAASAAGSSIHCSQPVTGPAELFGLLTPALAAVRPRATHPWLCNIYNQRSPSSVAGIPYIQHIAASKKFQ